MDTSKTSNRGSVLCELSDGLRRAGLELGRAWWRIRQQRALARLDRLDTRARDELEWLRAELDKAERNFRLMHVVHANRRRNIQRSLDSSAGHDLEAK